MKQLLLKPSISNMMIPKGVIMGRFLDLTGGKFGRLTVLKRVENCNQGKPKWLCMCECGNETKSTRNDLRNGDKKSCGCLRRESLVIDLTGQKFGKLTVISEYGKKGKSSSLFWNCQCDCGNNHLVSSQHLREGLIKSCGCLKEYEIDMKKYSQDFFRNIDKTDCCWTWTGRQSRGYGLFFTDKIIKAHRFSYLFHKGKISKGKIICHTCDNPLCVNPEHLYEGTHKDNAQDREQRGRGRKPKMLNGR